jgi:SagB-type dehydrogenase family enzyme
VPNGGRYVRRSRSLVAHWAGGRLVIQNYATGGSYDGPPLASAILSAADRWTRCDDIATSLGHADPATIAEVIDELVAADALLTMDGGSTEADRALERLSGWNPAVGFYHRSTRDVKFTEGGESRTKAVLTLRPHAPPEPKTYPEATSVALPDYARRGSFPEALLGRRTWRRFGTGSVSLAQMSSLMGLTWGVQRWVKAGEKHRLALTTSPSGGALHSLEAYALVFDVDGIDPGTYHYDADRHCLERLSPRLSTELLPGMLPAQRAYHDPCVLVFMSSVFTRVYWKYDHPRAYRVILLEAGHCAQTFCLVATWLGLAPFCTAALGDSAIERHLGIDGITESVLYAVGAGTRPRGLKWAPDPDNPDPPPTEPPGHANRRAKRRRGGPPSTGA